MKKWVFFLLPFLLAGIGLTYAAEPAQTDHALEVAAYQQGEAADTSPPVTTVQPAPPVPETPPATSNPSSSEEVSKNTPSFSEQIANLQNDINQIQDRQDAFAKQLNQLQYVGVVLSGVILLLAFLLLKSKKKSKMTHKQKSAHSAHNASIAKTTPIEDDTRAEYDFMGSHEGIPAKLDLARAYIAMEDYTSARETLSEILGEGNEQQRQEARILLSKIKD